MHDNFAIVMARCFRLSIAGLAISLSVLTSPGLAHARGFTQAEIDEIKEILELYDFWDGRDGDDVDSNCFQKHLEKIRPGNLGLDYLFTISDSIEC